MNNLKDEMVMFGGDGLLAIFTAVQIDAIMKWISLALTILTTIVTLAFTIYKWWRKAKEDGKIDEEEIEQLIDIVDDAKDKANDIADEIKKNKENKENDE